MQRTNILILSALLCFTNAFLLSMEEPQATNKDDIEQTCEFVDVFERVRKEKAHFKEVFDEVQRKSERVLSTEPGLEAWFAFTAHSPEAVAFITAVSQQNLQLQVIQELIAGLNRIQLLNPPEDENES